MIEEWRNVPGYDGYEASSLGRFRRDGRLIEGSVSKSTGYRRTVAFVDGARKEVLFHRMVAAAFIGPCPVGYEVNHIDAVRTNNVPTNLEYVTKSENQAYAWAIGRGPTGERHGRNTKPERTARGERVSTAVLTESEVRKMREMRATGASYSDLMRTFEVSKSQVANIVQNRQWRHVQ